MFFRTNHTFTSHLRNCEGSRGNKKVISDAKKEVSEADFNDGNFGEEEFNEELLLGEEFDLDENSELELLKIKEEFASIKQETDEYEIKLEKVKNEMSDDPSFTPKKMTLEVSGSINLKIDPEIFKLEEKQEMVEGDIAAEKVKIEEIETHELKGEYVEYDENPANEFQKNESLDEKKEKNISLSDVKSETYIENVRVESSKESIEILDSDEEEEEVKH